MKSCVVAVSFETPQLFNENTECEFSVGSVCPVDAESIAFSADETAIIPSNNREDAEVLHLSQVTRMRSRLFTQALQDEIMGMCQF